MDTQPTTQRPPRPLYQAFASMVLARQNCAKSDNTEWRAHWTTRLSDLTVSAMPSGSGWDSGTRLDLERSHADKLVFYGSFHHMDDGGSYDGWTDHEIIVRPSLAFGIDVRVTGRDRNGIKEYLAEMFTVALMEEVQQ